MPPANQKSTGKNKEIFPHETYFRKYFFKRNKHKNNAKEIEQSLYNINLCSNVLSSSFKNTLQVPFGVHNTKFKIPSFWSLKDRWIWLDKKKRFDWGDLELDASNLRVIYRGLGRSDEDAAAIRSNFTIPKDILLYYYEIEVINEGQDGYIGLGLCSSEVELDRLPGWENGSLGYHGDDGHTFRDSGTGIPYGPSFRTGDIVGVCLNLKDNSVFFTKNGIPNSTAFKNVFNRKIQYLKPVIGLRTMGEEIFTNFGKDPFVFDLNEYYYSFLKKISKRIFHITKEIVHNFNPDDLKLGKFFFQNAFGNFLSVPKLRKREKNNIFGQSILYFDSKHDNSEKNFSSFNFQLSIETVKKYNENNFLKIWKDIFQFKSQQKNPEKISRPHYSNLCKNSILIKVLKLFLDFYRHNHRTIIEKNIILPIQNVSFFELIEISFNDFLLDILEYKNFYLENESSRNSFYYFPQNFDGLLTCRFYKNHQGRRNLNSTIKFGKILDSIEKKKVSSFLGLEFHILRNLVSTLGMYWEFDVFSKPLFFPPKENCLNFLDYK